MAKTNQVSNKQLPLDAILVTTEKFTGTITFKTGTHTAYGMAGIYPSSKTTYSVNNTVPITKKVKEIVIYKTPKKEKFILASSISSTAFTSSTGTLLKASKIFFKVGSKLSLKSSTTTQNDSYSKNNNSKNKNKNNSANNNKPAEDGTDTTPTVTEEELQYNKEIIDNTAAGATSSGVYDSVDADVNAKDLMSKSMNGIFGLPYQWMDTCDNRLKNSDFGRMYADKIAARMPLLFLTPGSPSFMPGSDEDTKSSVKSLIVQSLGGVTKGIEDAVSTFLGEAGEEGCNKFYSFKFEYDDYYAYVNPMCQITARLLNLTTEYGKVKVNGKPRDLEHFDWSKSLSGKFSDYFSSVNSIPFYIDAISTVNESFSNETTASFLANTAKSASSTAKEMQFLVGSAASIGKKNGLLQKMQENLNNAFTDIANNATASGFINKVSGSMASIANGGGLLFPDIWDSSSFGRSYNISMKLRSPDGDDLSIYMNILVPLFHLLAMVAPHMIDNNYNAYSAPFLVRAYCKGAFNIHMGIITSMDISKGKEGSWNANGLPTEMDISITIKDLYELFSLTPMEDKGLNVIGNAANALKVVKNTAMMDYLCNSVGLNINKSELLRDSQVFLTLTENGIKNWPNQQWLKFQNAVDNKIHSVFSLRSK